MIFSAKSTGIVAPLARIRLRCPSCRQLATLDEFKDVNDVTISASPAPVLLGQRRCPNPDCHAHIFFAQQSDKVLISYPAEKIEFNSSDIPEAIVRSLEEAITCHANRCFIASAIMVRKTLEELCNDRGAQGKNLKARIQDLGTKIVLPRELLNGMDDLRLLGNDAAHIESQEYNQISQEEVEVGIELTKEVLKATYQYSALLGQLRKLKKQAI